MSGLKRGFGVGRWRACFALACTISGMVGATPTPSHLKTKPDERTELFKWLDSAGFPEVSSGKFISIDAGGSDEFGFLKSGSDLHFRATSLGFLDGPFHDQNVKFSEHFGFSTFKPADFAKWIKAYMSSLSKASVTLKWRNQAPIDSSFDAVLILSRACAARGMEPDSIQLFNRARMAAAKELNPFQAARNATTLVFKKHVVEYLFERTILDLGDPRVARSELLSQFRWLAANTPAADYSEASDDPYSPSRFIAGSIRMLEQMIKEDKGHPRITPVDLEKLPLEAKIAELIFELRDQPRDFIVSYNLPAEWPTNTSPDVKLAKIGLAAVPQLIEALHDTRFVRALKDDFSTYSITERPFRIRDAALGILSEISHVSFWPAGTVSISGSSRMEIGDRREADWEPTIEKERKWWSDIQKKGEFQTDIDLLKIREYDTSNVAKWLAKAYPKETLSAITWEAAVNKDEILSIRYDMLLAKIRPSKSIEALKSEMINSGNREKRVNAAKIVGLWEPDAEMRALNVEWKRALHDVIEFGPDRSVFDLTKELVEVDRPDAIDTIADGFQNLSADRKSIVLFFLQQEAVGWQLHWVDTRPPSSKAAFDAREKSIESLLTSELSDTQIVKEATVFYRQYPQVRICEQAAYVLADIWPEKYQFTMDATVEERNRQIAECLRTWQHTRQ